MIAVLAVYLVSVEGRHCAHHRELISGKHVNWAKGFWPAGFRHRAGLHGHDRFLHRRRHPRGHCDPASRTRTRDQPARHRHVRPSPTELISKSDCRQTRQYFWRASSALSVTRPIPTARGVNGRPDYIRASIGNLKRLGVETLDPLYSTSTGSIRRPSKKPSAPWPNW